ncbi:hypothetical protein HYFRA_00009474 [Hymenoscyphus fraxineus]|uniref:Uncharacterized protein n=1 Tax=Hymenoscyphus fraxineus TaxID=746836 RepID=A0A9N9PQ91_9HELO|nr:hypothetical protein HYFRA_00009474 [Hymenoscyphus fraxineus]
MSIAIATLSRGRAALRPKPKWPNANANAFLQSPPTSRAFHASPRPRFLETFIVPTHTLFEGVHSLTGLPWAYSIPLTTIVIRIFTLPISIYTRRIQQKRAERLPLLSAWTIRLHREVMAQSGHLGPAAAQAALYKKLNEQKAGMLQRAGIETWKIFLPVVHLPIFLIVIETLRMMSGTEIGLLGTLFSGFGSSYSIPFLSATSFLTAWYEPTLATEGMMWFKDLTVADPEGRLSYILSGAMLMNVLHFGKHEAEKVPLPPLPVWGQRLNRALILICCLIGPLLSSTPSGILIYWISSSVLTKIQASVLDRAIPIRIIQPCKPRRFQGIGSSMTNLLK